MKSAKLIFFGEKAYLIKIGDRLHLASSDKEMCSLLNRECPYPKGKADYWTSENVECAICDSDFIDIRPTESKQTECPNCGYVALLNKETEE